MFEPAVGVTIADRYALTRKLGEGGMGSVWAALDNKLRREVAIKLVTERIADSERALARFEREAMAVARLRSPYIAQVYDYGVEDGSPYIIMELLEGHDLKAKLTAEGSLDIVQTAKIVVQACKALHAAHNAGVIHRDLKPANIFLAIEGGEEVAKVFDFGVAKALNDLADDTETTAEGVLLGTPKYMSPEQAHGAKEVDHRTDLWAMAVIAYGCLTGRLPFEGTGTGHVLVKICTETPPMPSELHDGVPIIVDEFFEKALAKDPAARFQDAKAFATAFAELAEVSLSTFSLQGKLGSGAHSRPNLAGQSWPSAPSHADHSISLDDELKGFDGASVSTMKSAGLQASAQLQADDGTLGPATRTDADTESVGLLARPATRWLAALAAAGAVAALVGVLVTRGGPAANPSTASPGGVGKTAPAEPAPVTTPDPADATPPSGASAAPVASDETPPPEGDEEAASDDEKGDPDARQRPAKPAVVRPPVVAPKKDEPAPKEPEEPAPKPTPKPKSKDGLDLFDQRW